jgi:putative membrane protein
MQQTAFPNKIINIVSIGVPVIVAILLSMPNKFYFGEWTKALPHAIGIINSLTVIFLIAGLVFIKQGKINLHRYSMTISFVLGALFLVCYVIYHLSNPPTKFTQQGFIRYFYFFVLITHIGLSLIVLPLVLRAMFFALSEQFDLHRKTVKFAYPIWLYVSVTGVMVYVLSRLI